MNNLDQYPSELLPQRKEKKRVASTIINHRRLTDIYQKAQENIYLNNSFDRKKD